MVYPLRFALFKEEILNGVKRQTVRLLRRRRPPRVGEILRLYYKGEFLMETVCREVLIMKWKDLQEDLELARLDGFTSLNEFKEWFKMYNPSNETLFMVIRW